MMTDFAFRVTRGTAKCMTIQNTSECLQGGMPGTSDVGHVSGGHTEPGTELHLKGQCVQRPWGRNSLNVFE